LGGTFDSIAANTTKRTLLPPLSNPCKRVHVILYPCHFQLRTSITDARALVRLQSDHVNRTLLPAFYRYLQAQDVSAQIQAEKEFLNVLEQLGNLLEQSEKVVLSGLGVSGEGEKRAQKIGLGLWVEGGDLGWTDVMVGPCASKF
jgi:glutathione S-transferase